MDRQTGVRESVLSIIETTRDPGRFSEANPFGGMRQSNYDDPRHDAQFPQHCLSRVRAALGALRETWKLEVRARSPEVTAGEHELSDLACAIVPPPRFVREPSMGPKMSPKGVFRRVSFCTTDGIDSFFRRAAQELAARNRAGTRARSRGPYTGDLGAEWHQADPDHE